jgi:hypothetical protein
MRKVYFLLAASLMIACGRTAKENADTAAAQPEAAAEAPSYPADSVGADGRSFHGLRIAEMGALPLAQLPGLTAEKGGIVEPVKVEGEITATCQAKGCWMTLKMADGSDMRVRFRDYGFFVPKDAAGKMAIVEGKAFLDTVSVESLRHYAVDGGMSEEEAEKKYTAPEITLSFEATGVIIRP